ncbi:hypothetical protein, partial [Paenalcaligenes suwonensis]|uniref:hypothetical protein n=1 Tax=Paenalcaligenes suwonensis TaxID=1202713 RepID=UPI00140A199F
MTNKTILSDNQVTRLSLSLKFQPSGSQPKDFLLRCDLVREIEQALLQSPEIQGVMDASKTVSKVFWATHLEYEKLHVAIKMLDAAIAA